MSIDNGKETLAYLVKWRNDLLGADGVIYNRAVYEILQVRIGTILDKIQESETPINVYPIGTVVASFMDKADLEQGVVITGVDKLGNRLVASSMHVDRVLKSLDETIIYILKDANPE